MNLKRKQELLKFISRLGLTADTQVNWSLLDIALTHPTMGTPNYDRLEFIGDSVVRLAASTFLWDKYPDGSVGDFSSVRRVLVSDRVLSQLADSYGFDRYLLVGASALDDDPGRLTRLADAFESVLAALYLSSHNLTLIRPWLDHNFDRLVTEILTCPARQNYKQALQELTQGIDCSLPEYRTAEALIQSSPSQRFIAEVWIKGKMLGSGIGHSKKAAEEIAAQAAYSQLSNLKSV